MYSVVFIISHLIKKSGITYFFILIILPYFDTIIIIYKSFAK